MVTVRNKEKKKLFNLQIYKHIQIYSFFNILYCFVTIFSLLNTCINNNSSYSLYCSTFYTQEWSQYVKIIVQHFLGNVLRTYINVSYLLFTLSRLVYSSKLKEGKFFGKILKLNLKLYVCILLIFSILISVFKLFQYEITTRQEKTGLSEYPLEKRNEFTCYFNYYVSECKLFDALKIINDTFNGIILFSLNILIDAFLLKYFNQEMKQKISIRSQNADNADLLGKSKKVKRLVIANGVLFFVSHLPDFVISILRLSFRQAIANFCTYHISCDLINEEGNFFNSLSIVLTFYLLLLFDRNFKESFDHLKDNFKSKLKCK